MEPSFRIAIVFFLVSAAAWATPPSVIVISIDTLRADHLSSYGYRKISTPNIDAFANGGSVFENIACQTPLTLPSHTSLFTSTYPFENGIQENAELVPAGAVTLAGVLKSHGYKTAAFIGSVFLERQMGLDQGFDTYDSPFNFEAFSPLSGEMFFGGVQSPFLVRDRRDGALVISSALRWFAANRDQPVFVFIHLFDLHTPYTIPPRNGVSRYDAQLMYVDGWIGKLTKALKQAGRWDKSLTVLLSDHGEGLGDHGETAHGYFVYQSTLHVPLIFHWPAGSANQRARVAKPGGLIDVAPTVLDFLHFPAPATFEGTTALTALPRPVYSETMHTHDSFGWSPLRSIRLGAYKYIDAPRPELYNLDKDPNERNDILRADSAEARALRVEMTKLLSRYAPRNPLPASGTNSQTERLLASLGYLGRGPRSRLTGPAPDPKDRLPEYRLYEQSMEAVNNHRPSEAVALLQKILAQDATNFLARRDLGASYLDLHQYAKARAAFTPLAAAVPDDYSAQFGLGLADKNLGLVEEARKHLEAACKIAPHAAQCRRELDGLKRGTN
jgi:arylsulfatase A-like enzyme